MLEGLHQRGFTDLIAPQLDVLRYPGPDQMRPSELAARTRMSKQALNYLDGHLEQLGYLTRESDPGDQRFRRVQLSAGRWAALRTIREIVAEVESDWEQQLGRESFAQLRDLLAAFG